MTDSDIKKCGLNKLKLFLECYFITNKTRLDNKLSSFFQVNEIPETTLLLSCCNKLRKKEKSEVGLGKNKNKTSCHSCSVNIADIVQFKLGLADI